MSLVSFVAKRYLISKSSQNAVNIINYVTFTVTVIGAASLFVVLSAFSGLRTFSLQFTNLFDPEIKIVPSSGKFFSFTSEDEEQIKRDENVALFSKELEDRAYLTFRDKNHIAQVKGVDQNFAEVIAVDSAMVYGQFQLNSQEAIIGVGAFNLLGGPLENYSNLLKILTLKAGNEAISMQKMASNSVFNESGVVVKGVFSINEELDRNFVLVTLEEAQELFEKDSAQVSGINILPKQGTDPMQLIDQLQSYFRSRAIVKSKKELNATLYRLLNTENMATYLIFTLVLVIAMFNVVGATIMMILDKKDSIRTLFAMGSTVREIRKIYFYQALLLCVVGGVFGLILGFLITASQLYFGFFSLGNGQAYPVALEPQNFLIVGVTLFVLGVISAYIGSARINRKLIATF